MAVAGAALTASVIAGVTHSAAATQSGTATVSTSTTTPASASTSTSDDSGTSGITTAPQQTLPVGGSNGS